MKTTTHRRAARNLGVSAVIVTALAMSGCGAGDDADFADGKSAEAASDLAPADSDLLIVPADGDVSDIATTDAVTGGEASTIIVPTGELEITKIAAVESVPAALVQNGKTPEEAAATSSDSDTGDQTSAEATQSDESLRAADGMELKLVSFSYSPGAPSSQASSPAAGVSTADPEIASPTMALASSDGSRELPKLDADMETTYLMSVPADGEASLAVTQDGHEQRIDLRSGQRQADEVASTYYREKTGTVVINEPLSFPETKVKIGGGKTNEYEHTLKMKTDLTDAELTPWTKEKGWAEAGSAWLRLNGEAFLDAGAGPLMTSSANVTYTLATGNGEDVTFSVPLEDAQGPEKFAEVVAVPVGTEKAAVSGSSKIDLDSLSLDVASDSPVTVDSQQPYEIDFGPAPTTDGATAPASDENS